MRLEVVLRVPDALSRKQREQLVELVDFLTHREVFINAVEQVGIREITVTTQNPALPQASDAAE